jgi:hypothetical protein
MLGHYLLGNKQRNASVLTRGYSRKVEARPEIAGIRSRLGARGEKIRVGSPMAQKDRSAGLRPTV